ncbi:hypothetical protein AB1Y20_003185 [Prymnesium parvum]|uniref:SPX domain-containing protein n=1 Tax=Prymnesium parvum TaxID=97485 RepID=A0AB34JCK2_PRYPA
MRFGRALREAQVPQWRSFYCDYDRLQQLIERCAVTRAADQPKPPPAASESEGALTPPPINAPLTSPARALTPVCQADVDFVADLSAQVDRVEDFYRKELRELSERAAVLLEQARRLLARREAFLTTEEGEAAAAAEAGGAPAERDGEPVAAADAVAPAADGAAAEGVRTGKLFTSKLIRSSMRAAFVELYRTGRLLETFCIFNSTAFFKILKKWRKRCPGPAAAPIEAQLGGVEAQLTSGLAHAAPLQRLLGALEQAFAETFCAASPRPLETARAQLLVRQHEPVVGDLSAFVLGWRVGVALLLMLWLLWDLSIDARLRPSSDHCVTGEGYGNQTGGGGTPYSLWDDPALQVYQLAGAMIFAYWCLGIVAWRLHLARINTSFLLEISSSATARPRDIFSAAAWLTTVHHADFFGASSLHKVNRALPLLLFLSCAAALVLPWRSRRRMWAMLWQVVSGRARFVHTFYADWFTSLVKVFASAAQATCYYASGEGFDECAQMRTGRCHTSSVMNIGVLPAISSLPLLLRLVQCLRRYGETRQRFPHLANAWKYCFALVIVVLGSTHNQWKKLGGDNSDAVAFAWIVSYIVSTLYTFSWDIGVDWELQHRLRGRRMVWINRWPYCVALVLDFFLRFVWTLTLAPGTTPFGSFVDTTLSPMLAYLEIGRRSLWSLIRLEREHLTNSASYSVVPLHFDNSTDHPTAPEPAEPKSSSAYTRIWRCTTKPGLVGVALEIGGFLVVVMVCYVISFVTASPHS